ncbi:MAG: hypothetical protein AB7V26_11780 [Lysobacterales bacterium]
MRFLHWFVAGFVATLVFHQGLLAVLHARGISPRPAWNMAATQPLGVPQVISLAFWGGVWAIAIGYAMGLLGWYGAWVWIVAGAILPSVVALGVVFPAKGLPVDRKTVIGALLLNAAWGLGVVLILELLARLV